jgi:hypothetical protein
MAYNFMSAVHKTPQKLGISKQKLSMRRKAQQQATGFQWRGYRTERSFVMAARCTQSDDQTKTVTRELETVVIQAPE